MCNLIHIKYYDHDTFFILLGELRKLGYDFSYRLNGKERDLNYIQDYDTFVSDNVKAKYMDYESIVTNGLVMSLDAGFRPSYPTTSTTWYNVSSNTNNGTLVNGPTFNSTNGGSISYDGSNDYVVLPNNTNLDSQEITMESWSSVNSVFQNGFLFEKGSVNTQYSNSHIKHHENKIYIF